VRSPVGCGTGAGLSGSVMRPASGRSMIIPGRGFCGWGAG
jgi:hypothetical protein